MADVVDAAPYELRVGLPARPHEELGEVTLAAPGESRSSQGVTGRGGIREISSSEVEAVSPPAGCYPRWRRQLARSLDDRGSGKRRLGRLGCYRPCDRIGGFDGLFRSDHYTSFHTAPGAALDAWATIAGLAAMTSRIRLGTLVTPATFRHPSELARVVVTADHISGGRVELGIGAGWFETEHRQNGFPFPPTPERFSMFSEYVEVLLRSWSAADVDFRGTHFTLEGQRALPGPVQAPHPPLIFGGRGRRRSLALAARFADEYNAAFLAADEVTSLRSRLDDAALFDRPRPRLPPHVPDAPRRVQARIARGGGSAEPDALKVSRSCGASPRGVAGRGGG